MYVCMYVCMYICMCVCIPFEPSGLFLFFGGVDLNHFMHEISLKVWVIWVLGMYLYIYIHVLLFKYLYIYIYKYVKFSARSHISTTHLDMFQLLHQTKGTDDHHRSLMKWLVVHLTNSSNMSGTYNGGILTYVSCMDTAYAREFSHPQNSLK